MKMIFKRVAAVLLAAVLLVQISAPAHAVEENYVYIYASSDQQPEERLLRLLNMDGVPFIATEDIAALTGLTYEITDEGTFFYICDMPVKLDTADVKAGELTYWELKPTMDLLYTQYALEADGSLLFVSHGQRFAEIYELCNEIFDGGYDVSSLRNDFANTLSVLYSVFSGLRVDYFVGGYTIEVFENALTGMLIMDDATAKSVWEACSNASDSIKLLGNMANLNLHSTHDLKQYTSLFGYEFDQFAQGYLELTEIIDPDLVFSTAEQIYLGQSASKLYVKAMKYSLVENDYLNSFQIIDFPMRKAISDIYGYCKDGKASYQDIFNDVGHEVLGDATNYLIKETLVDSGLLFSGAFGLCVDMIFAAVDLLGMENYTDAMEQSHCCIDLQQYISRQNMVYRGRMKKEASLEDLPELLIAMKYGAIFYARAYQYAYSLYDYVDELKGPLGVAYEKVSKVIAKLASYDDGLFTMLVDNPELDMSHPGFMTDPEHAVDLKPMIGYWTAPLPEGSPLYWPNTTMSVYRVENRAITFDVTINGHQFTEQRALFAEDGTSQLTLIQKHDGTEYCWDAQMKLEGNQVVLTYYENEEPHTLTLTWQHHFPMDGPVMITVRWNYEGEVDLTPDEYGNIITDTNQRVVYKLKLCGPNGEEYSLPMDMLDVIYDENGQVVASNTVYSYDYLTLALFDPSYTATLELTTPFEANKVSLNQLNPQIYVTYAKDHEHNYYYTDYYTEYWYPQGNEMVTYRDAVGREVWIAIQLVDGVPCPVKAK